MKSKKFLIFRIIVIIISSISLISIELYQRNQIKQEEKIIEEEQNITVDEKLIDMAKLYITNNQDYYSEIVKEKDFEYRINTDKFVEQKLIDNNDEYKGYIKVLNDEFSYVKSENMLINNINDKDYVDGINNEKKAYDIKYIYKGSNPNNYIKYNGELYRIIGITNSDDLKIINTKTETEENWGLSGNINYLETTDNIVNKKGIFYVGYVRSETNKIDQIMKNEKRNNMYTIVPPKYYGDYSYVNISDIINASDNCVYSKITDIKKDTCSSYLMDLLKDTYTSNTAENNMVYKVNEKQEIVTTKLGEDIRVNKVTYVSLLNEYKSGNGTKENPYEIK